MSKNTGHCVTRIVSGGQTGVDRGALSAAIDLGISHGGWCPRGRLAEDGLIPARYDLLETKSRKYRVRTEQNVIDSDATLILYREVLSGGSELTRQFAVKHDRPVLLIDLERDGAITDARKWLAQVDVKTLNVAGPRESGTQGVGQQAYQFLVELFS